MGCGAKEEEEEDRCGEAKGCCELDMCALAKAERNRSSSRWQDRAERLLEDEVLVIFELPDGSEGERHFKRGHTVALLKSFLEEEYEIPAAEQRLFLNGKIMLDPFCLCDFTTKHNCIVVTVEGLLPASAAKK